MFLLTSPLSSLYYNKTEKHSVQHWATERFDWRHAAFTSPEILIGAGYTSGLFGRISILCEQKVAATGG